MTRSSPFTVEIIDAPARTLIGLEHRGPYPGIAAVFARVAGWAASRGLYGPAAEFCGIYYDNPDDTPAEALRSFAGSTPPPGVDVDSVIEGDFKVMTLAAGPAAWLRFVGPYDGLPPAYRYLYGVWLPQSGRVHADRPSFEINPNSPKNTPAEELITDIYLPLVE